MKKDKVYIDTSIVGGLLDVEFKKETELLFRRLEKNEIIFVISDLMELELSKAPERVRCILTKYSEEKFERVLLTKEAQELGKKYIEENVVGESSLEDCYHIAIATINNVSVLASWNFKHIVNLSRIKGYNSVNLRLGYNMLEIRSPKDLINYNDEEE